MNPDDSGNKKGNDNSKSVPSLTNEEKKRLAESYRLLDDVMMEVEFSEKEIRELICEKLRMENESLKNHSIENICVILKKYGNSPSVELLQECRLLLTQKESK